MVAMGLHPYILNTIHIIRVPTTGFTNLTAIATIITESIIIVRTINTIASIITVIIRGITANHGVTIAIPTVILAPALLSRKFTSMMMVIR